MTASRTVARNWWNNSVMLLSLDVCIPFSRLIGLDPAAMPHWHTVMRDFIRWYRKRCQLDPKYHETQQPDSVVQWIAGNVSQQRAGVFRWWVENIYGEGPQDHLALDYWICVLRELRGHNALNELGLSQDATRFVSAAFNESTNRDEFYELAEFHRREPLSDWDLHMYAVNFWNDDLPDAPNGPLSTLYLVTSAFAAFKFWRNVIDHLDSGELQTMWQRAERYLATSNDLRFIPNLAPPQTFLLVTP